MPRYAVAARLLLGLIFLVAGAAKFVFLVHPPPLPPGLAGEFMSVFLRSHWVAAVGLVEFVAGALLLVNRYVILAMTVLAAVIVNILIFHATMMPIGIFPGILAAVLWIVAALPLRNRFAPLLREI